jgi:hypothetical protein
VRYLIAFFVAVVGGGAAVNGQVNFTINANQGVQPISPLIYGVNGSVPQYSNPTAMRLGGNRWTAYNWENNDSNAGSDYYYENDGLLSSSTTPGAAVLPAIQSAAANNQTLLLTIPINGYVSADRNGGGDVRYNNNTYDPSTNGWIDGTPNPNYLSQRFIPEYPTKPASAGPLSLTPNPSDDAVYENEFVYWVNHQLAAGQQVNYELDNEPDLWDSTHAEVHPNPTTYSEIVSDAVAYSTAIKGVAPNALVYGPVSYGWQGFQNLQNAPDAAGKGNFISYYLSQMNAASQSAGKRLLDVLDVHWYPEATGGGDRITDSNPATEDGAAVDAARLQAPRSLWDPTYVENSWITQYSTGGAGINLLPTLKQQIAQNYAGTKLSISEYNYGDGDHINGGLAEADVLGIFGQQGVYSANEWQLGSNETYIGGAFDMFRNFDGKGGHFGDISISSLNSDTVDSSVYASLDSTNPNHMVLVLINKTSGSLTANLAWGNINDFTLADIYTLTAAGPTPVFAGAESLSNPDGMSYSMPGYSVSTINLVAVPEPAALAVIAVGGLGILRRPRHIAAPR